MTSDETKNYIDQRLHELGLALQLDDGGYEKIHRFTNGTESGVNQLCFKLVSLTADNNEREVTTERVSKAIDELARIDEMMKRASRSDVRQIDDEMERSSIDQLAAMLEANTAVVSAAAEVYAPPRPTRTRPNTKRSASERRPKILIVNEAKTTRALLVNALTPDFDCIETADTDDAWRRLVHQTDIDLVITDVRAHDRAQYDLIGRVRSAAAPGHLIGIPIIAMAATDDANAKQRALVAGANDVIAMNTSAGELKTRVSARYKASRVAPQYGAPVATKPNVAERATERKNGAAASAPKAAPRPANANPSRPALSTSALDEVRRPFLNTPSMARRVPTRPSRFLEWLYQVSSTTTVTLSATILVVVLLAVIMYVNRMSDTPPLARAPTTPPAPQTNAQPVPTPPTTVQPTPADSSPPLAMAPTDRGAVDTRSKSSAKDETQPRDLAASAAPPASETRARTDAPRPAETDVKPEPLRPSAEPLSAARALDQRSAAMPAPSTPRDAAVAPAAEANAEIARNDAAKAPPPERITRDDLATLLKRFTYVYEAGDIEQFMNLFAVNARTNDRMNRDGIRQDYETLFRSTDLRQFKLSHINWEVDSNQAHGWGNFEVTVRRAGDQELHNYSGSLTLYVERVDGRPRIVRLYHGQRRAGS